MSMIGAGKGLLMRCKCGSYAINDDPARVTCDKCLLRHKIEALEIILRKIIGDGTGDLENPAKRLWPIRAANYREAAKLLKR